MFLKSSNINYCSLKIFAMHWLRYDTLRLINKYKRWRVLFLITVLTPPHFCGCPMPWPGFPNARYRGLFFIRTNQSTITYFEGRGGRNRMVVGFTTTCAISAYYQWCCEFEVRSGRCVLDTTLCDKVSEWLATGRWFSPGPTVSSTNKTDRHDIAEILLKVALNTLKQTNKLAYIKTKNTFKINSDFNVP